MLTLIKETWNFLKIRKKIWLLPILLILMSLVSLILFSQGNAVAPFTYTLF